MATIQQVSPILPVRDLDAALEHYRRLGFETAAHPVSERPEIFPYGFARWGDAELHLAHVDHIDAEANRTGVYLLVDDVDALHSDWEAAGVEGRMFPPKDTDHGTREAAHIDLDGNLIRIGTLLQQGADPTLTGTGAGSG